MNRTINGNVNDTITLDNDYAFNQTTDSAFMAGIEISRPVTIIGNNHSIDGKGQAGIFWVTGDNVSINNIIFVNGYDDFDAGAIYWEGANGAVSGSVFSGNTADHVGGAIVWRGANGTVSDSIFIGNNASQDGGAIYWWAENGTVLRSSFINNYADNNGGAVYWTEENGTVSDSIFINNTARRGFAVHATELLKVDYCWFGGNATNYMDTLPIGGEAHCDYILFLNATANPNPVQLFGTSEVIFKLYLYNSGNISEYDNTRLPPFNLRITSTNGDVDTNMVTFGDSIKYTATGVGIGSVTADFMNVAASAILTVNKVKTVLTANAVTATYSTNKNLVITLKDDKGKALSGVKVTVNLNGAKTYTTDKNGQIKINVAKVVPKTYTAKITFNGNDVYDKSAKNVKVVVKKAKAKITAKKKTFKKSKKVKKYAITLKSGKNPIKKVKVTIKIGKKTFKAKTNAKGKATFKIKKLTKKGKYKAVVKFNGNKYYNKVTKKVKINLK